MGGRHCCRRRRRRTYWCLVPGRTVCWLELTLSLVFLSHRASSSSSSALPPYGWLLDKRSCRSQVTHKGNARNGGDRDAGAENFRNHLCFPDVALVGFHSFFFCARVQENCAEIVEMCTKVTGWKKNADVCWKCCRTLGKGNCRRWCSNYARTLRLGRRDYRVGCGYRHHEWSKNFGLNLLKTSFCTLPWHLMSSSFSWRYITFGTESTLKLIVF